MRHLAGLWIGRLPMCLNLNTCGVAVLGTLRHASPGDVMRCAHYWCVRNMEYRVQTPYGVFALVLDASDEALQGVCSTLSLMRASADRRQARLGTLEAAEKGA